jgi:hypothetical protein
VTALYFLFSVSDSKPVGPAYDAAALQTVSTMIGSA